MLMKLFFCSSILLCRFACGCVCVYARICGPISNCANDDNANCMCMCMRCANNRISVDTAHHIKIAHSHLSICKMDEDGWEEAQEERKNLFVCAIFESSQ